MSKPFLIAAQYMPKHDWPRWLLFSFWFWTYVGMIVLVVLLVRWVRYKWFVSVEYVTPARVLFHNEMAAAIQVLEQEESNSAEMDSTVKQLMERIVDRMREIFSLNSADFRAIAIRPDPEDEKDVIFTKMQFGKTDDLSEQQKGIDKDAAKFMLEEKLTTHTKWLRFKEHRPKGNAETVILIRNIGMLRLGLFIAITRADIKIEENWPEFEQSTYLATMLGHVDKLVEVVVNYE
ncbi:hypothetical protein KZ483_25800 [Paenibacillus sp. sptzw28]|uniref:hypothetical protein n=1 Tax=Paenibacillus sp. sptzw28 TaxID=715179 RepID=UPI001C6F05E1|nr:hypothetical protein [Paenibacillus sp. sptzw28]QYR21092.1 hypothetical protein KZ483_25800 [Paenibacillus sp. sptzw28]